MPPGLVRLPNGKLVSRGSAAERAYHKQHTRSDGTSDLSTTPKPKVRVKRPKAPEPKAYRPPSDSDVLARLRRQDAGNKPHFPGLDDLGMGAVRAAERAAHYFDKIEHQRNKRMHSELQGKNKPPRGWGGLLSDVAHDSWGKLESSIEGPPKKPYVRRAPLIPSATFAHNAPTKPLTRDQELAAAIDVAIGREPSFGASAKATKPDHGLPQFLETITGQPYGERAFQNDLGDRDYSNPWDLLNVAAIFPLGRPIKGAAAGVVGAKALIRGEEAAKAAKGYYHGEGVAWKAAKKGVGLRSDYRMIWHPGQQRWVKSAIPSYTTRTGRVAEKATERVRKALGSKKWVPMKRGDAKLAQMERQRSTAIFDPVRTWRAKQIGQLGRTLQSQDPVAHYALRVIAADRSPEMQARYYRRQAELAREAGDESSAQNLLLHANAFDQVQERGLVAQGKDGHWHISETAPKLLKVIDKSWARNQQLREQGLVEMGILDPETILRRIDAPAAEIDHALSGLRESADRARILKDLQNVDPDMAETWIKLFDARSLHEAERIRNTMDDIYHQQLHLKNTGQSWDEQALDKAAYYRRFGVPNDFWYTKMRAINSDWTAEGTEAIRKKFNLVGDVAHLMQKHKAKGDEGRTFQFHAEAEVDTNAEKAWWDQNGDWAFRIPFLIDRKDPTFVVVGAPGDMHGDIMPPGSNAWGEFFQGQALVDSRGTTGPDYPIINVSFGDEIGRLTPLQKKQIDNQVRSRYASWRKNKFQDSNFHFSFEGPPLEGVAKKAEKNLKAKTNPGRREFSHGNERVRRGGIQITGPITSRSWMTRVKNLIPDAAERHYWAHWYESFEPLFREVFGADADAIMRGFALSQQNTGPAGGMSAVLKVMDRMRHGEEVNSEGIGMIAEAVHLAIQNSPLEKGAAAKLSDFKDALELRNTRGWMGHETAGGAPAPVDIWAGRDLGWVDKKFAKKLKEVFDLDVNIDLPRAPSGIRYEQMSEQYAQIAKDLNKAKFDGREDWTPAQAQALGWATVQKMVGVDPEDLAYALDRNAYEMAFEFTQGTKGLGNDLSIDEGKEVGRLMEQRMRDIVEDTDGVYWVPGQEIQLTTGGWSGGQNAAAQFKVVGEARAVGHLVQRLAIAFDQEWVQAARITSSASNAPRSALVIESDAFADETVKQTFFERLNARSPTSKNPATHSVEDDIQGYMKGEGNSIVIRTHRGTATGKGVDKFMNRYDKVVQAAAKDVGIEAKLSPSNVALITGGAHGVENPLLTAKGVSAPVRRDVDDQLALGVQQELEQHIDAVRAAAGRDKPAPPSAEVEAGRQAEVDKAAIIRKVIEDNEWPKGAQSERYAEQFLEENPDFAPGWEDVWNRAEEHKQSQYPDWARESADHGGVPRGVEPFDGGLLYSGDDGSLGIRFTGDSERGAADSAPGYDSGFDRQDQLDVADMYGPGEAQPSLHYDPQEPPVSSDAEDAVQQFNEFIRREQRLDETPEETETRLLREAAEAMHAGDNDIPDHAPDVGRRSLADDPEGSTPGDIGTRQWAEGLLGPRNTQNIIDHNMTEDDIHALFDNIYNSPNVHPEEIAEIVDWVNRVYPPEGGRHETGGFTPPQEVIDPRPPNLVTAEDLDETLTGLSFEDAFPEASLPSDRWVEGVLGGTLVAQIRRGAFNEQNLDEQLRNLVLTSAHDHDLTQQQTDDLLRWVDSHVQGFNHNPVIAESHYDEEGNLIGNPIQRYTDPEGSHPGDFGTRMWADNLIGSHIVTTVLNGSLHPEEARRLVGLARSGGRINATEAVQLDRWFVNQTHRLYPEVKEVPKKTPKAKRPNYRVEEAKYGDEYWQYYGEKSTFHMGSFSGDKNHVIFNLYDDDNGDLVGSINAYLKQPYTDWTGKEQPAHLEVSELFIKGNSRSNRRNVSHADEVYDSDTGAYRPRDYSETDYRKDIGAFMALVKPITEVAEEWKIPIHADFANYALSKIAQKWSKRLGRDEWIPEELRQIGYFREKGKKKVGFIHGLHQKLDGGKMGEVTISARTPQKHQTMAHEVLGHFEQLVIGLSPEHTQALRDAGYLPATGSIDDLPQKEATDLVEKFAGLAENWAFYGGEGLPVRVKAAYRDLSAKVRKDLKKEAWNGPRRKPKRERGEIELLSYMDDMFSWEDAMNVGGRYAPETRASQTSLRRAFDRFRRTEGQARSYHSSGALSILGNDPATTHKFAAKLMQSGYFTGEVTKGIRSAGMKMAKLMSFADIRKAALKIATDVPTASTDIPIRDNITHGYRRRGEASGQVSKTLDILRSMEIDERQIDVKELEEISPEVLQDMVDFISPGKIDGDYAHEVAARLIKGTQQPIPNIKWISREAAEEFGLMDSGVTRLAKQAWGAEAAGKAADALNAWARLQILYLNPAYYPMNFIGNGVMNLIQQGVFYLPNTRMAANLSKNLGEESAAIIDSAMGTGLSESMGFREHGPDAAIRNAMNNFANNLVDKIPRRASFFHEARRMGFDEDWRVKALLDAVDDGDQEALDVFAMIVTRAKDAIVDYDRLNPFEKNVVSRLIFFYPWIKGATRWTAQFPLNHPVQATAFAAALAAQQYYANKDIGDRPWYLDLDVPLPFRNAEGDQYSWNPRQAFTFTTPWDLAKTGIEFTPGLKDIVPGEGQPLAEMAAPVPGAMLTALAGHRSFDDRDVPSDFGTFYNEYASLPPVVSKLYSLFGPADSNFHGLRGPASDQSNFLYPRSDFDKVMGIIFGGLAPHPINKDKAHWLAQGQRGQSPTAKWEGWQKEFKATFNEDPSPALKQAVTSKIEWESMKDRGKPDEEDFPDGTKTISVSRLRKKIDLAIKYDPSLRSRRTEMLEDMLKGYEWRRNIDSFLERAMGWSALAGISEDINARQRAVNQ